MPSCLGLYIEENIIKYAKVSKDRDNLKVDAFGMNFYDGSVEKAISKVIADTFSYKTPVSINLSEEMYHYFYVFSLLNKNDIPKAIETEFESICYDNGYNKNALESRYALVNNPEDKEKLKVIHIAANKTEIAKKIQELEGNKLTSIAPLSMALPNLINEEENAVIVNIENKTTVTTIIDGNVNNVDVIAKGAREILNNINAKENSYQKAYNICKDTTIYTSAGKELQEETNEYLEDIMPTLYDIVIKVKNVIGDNIEKIKKIYITGTGSVINNIDLYFNEYITEAKCEILKPYFIDTKTKKINIKDYIEVNSAISLALQGLGIGIRGMNFKKPNLLDQLPDWMKVEVGGGAKKLSKDKKPSKFNLNIHFDLKEKLDAVEKNLLRVAGGLLMIVVVFMVFSGILTAQMKNKEKEVNEVIADTKAQIASVSADNGKVNAKTTQYKNMIENLNKLSEALNEKYQLKEAVPNLLNQIMYVIPQDVQVTSIENTSGKHIKITAQAQKYESLGIFKAQLKNQQILKDIVSDQGVKENDIVKITIEGELP